MFDLGGTMFGRVHVNVVKSGHRLYKEDGTDDFLEVLEGQIVMSMNAIYMVEADYARMKEKMGEQIHE